MEVGEEFESVEVATQFPSRHMMKHAEQETVTAILLVSLPYLQVQQDLQAKAATSVTNSSLQPRKQHRIMVDSHRIHK